MIRDNGCCYGMATVVSFVSLWLCVDFCSNMILFLLLSNKMAQQIDAFLSNYGDHAGIQIAKQYQSTTNLLKTSPMLQMEETNQFGHHRLSFG